MWGDTYHECIVVFLANVGFLEKVVRKVKIASAVGFSGRIVDDPLSHCVVRALVGVKGHLGSFVLLLDLSC